MMARQHRLQLPALVFLAACSLWLAPGAVAANEDTSSQEDGVALTHDETPSTQVPSALPARTFAPKFAMPMNPPLRRIPGKPPADGKDAKSASTAGATNAATTAKPASTSQLKEAAVPMPIVRPHCTKNADGQELPAAEGEEKPLFAKPNVSEEEKRHIQEAIEQASRDGLDDIQRALRSIDRSDFGVPDRPPPSFPSAASQAAPTAPAHSRKTVAARAPRSTPSMSSPNGMPHINWPMRGDAN